MRSRLIALLVVMAACAFPGGQGSTTVTTAGTPVQLLAGTSATGCTITAKSTNTGTIWIGLTSAVSAAGKLGTPLGPPLATGQPGATYTCIPGAKPFSLGSFWLDATVSGDGVTFSWF